jgi:hypothetical protein
MRFAVSAPNCFSQYEKLIIEAYHANLSSYQRERLETIASTLNLKNHVAIFEERWSEERGETIASTYQPILQDSWEHQVVITCQKEGLADDFDQTMEEFLHFE